MGSYEIIFGLEDSQGKISEIHMGCNRALGNFLESGHNDWGFGFLSKDVNYQKFNLEHNFFYHHITCNSISEGENIYLEPCYNDPKIYKKVLIQIKYLCEKVLEEKGYLKGTLNIYGGICQGIAITNLAMKTNQRIVMLIAYG